MLFISQYTYCNGAMKKTVLGKVTTNNHLQKKNKHFKALDLQFLLSFVMCCHTMQGLSCCLFRVGPYFLGAKAPHTAVVELSSVSSQL